MKRRIDNGEDVPAAILKKYKENGDKLEITASLGCSIFDPEALTEHLNNVCHDAVHDKWSELASQPHFAHVAFLKEGDILNHDTCPSSDEILQMWIGVVDEGTYASKDEGRDRTTSVEFTRSQKEKLAVLMLAVIDQFNPIVARTDMLPRDVQMQRLARRAAPT